MPRPVTREDIINFISDNPRRRNTNLTCSLVNTKGEPRCVIGHILVHVGGRPGYELVELRHGSVDGYPDAWIADDARELAQYVQEEADDEATWGDALDNGLGREEAEEMKLARDLNVGDWLFSKAGEWSRVVEILIWLPTSLVHVHLENGTRHTFTPNQPVAIAAASIETTN